ncbi:hypothetical protein ACHAXS_002840 [Conticribra weissflogii]
MVKNELIFLAKMAIVFSVVDGFIPQAENLAKKMSHQHQTDHPKNEGPIHRTNVPDSQNNNGQVHYPYATEMYMGLFDFNAFHGSGSGGTKEALDEQWEIQQAILRERRGHTDSKGHLKKSVPLSKIGKIDVEHAAKIKVDDVEHVSAKKSSPKFFWMK